MTKAESKVIDFIKKHILLFLLVAVTIIAIFLRACGMDFQSDDFNSFFECIDRIRYRHTGKYSSFFSK